MAQRRLWTNEEDQIIKQLVKQYGVKRWTTIAEQMRKLIDNKSRSSKQIRQRWHNHLDPNINKKQWTNQQQKILFDLHRQYGSKWKQIANSLSGRTDNHVKNYFYSTMRRALRRVNKFLGSKNSTTQMRIIRPSILAYLLDLGDIDAGIRSLVSRILELSKFKPKRSTTKQFIFADQEKQKYQGAIKKLIQINEMYTKSGIRKFYQKNSQTIKKQQEEHLQQIRPIIQSNILTKQEDNNDQSWQDQNEESYHYNQNCHLMPQIEKPEYQCDLLAKKEENLQPTNHIQFCMGEDGLWTQQQTIETINLFQF